ncbi:MAG: DNA methyltransferase [Byssovorax sp.]
MDLTTRKTLREALTKLSTEIAAALRTQLLAPGPTQERARVLHRDEKVGDAFELWTDLLSRRAAVLWVLKSLYVRALEDRGLLRPGRILDPESEQLFAHLAPNLGPTAYLRWVFRDLSTGQGGLPELFAPQPAEIGVVPDALSSKLIDLWRSKDLDSGALRYRFDDEHFDGRLLGDLYQDLDPVVKKRYALLQTPDFVLDFILDETLTPAIAEFGIETVRLLDPACGSGHFLLAGFKRIVAGMREKEPGRDVREVVKDVLDRVVGIDLNDYACGLARARLVMTALEICGETDLGAAHDFHPRVYCADALEQVEEEQQLTSAALDPVARESNGMLTPPEIRAALRKVLKPRFHAVVGNPPYITEKDATKREYHKEKVGKTRRYVSAAGKYSLGAPFTERMLQLAVDGGFMGEITADSFMKREFGKALIQEVLAKRDLRKVVSTSGAYIPGHGTPTVIFVCAQPDVPRSSTRTQ